MKKSLVLTVVALCFVSITAFAQNLAPSVNSPAADGVIGSTEYASIASLGDMKLATSLSQDGKTLYVALEAPSSGWVAVGLGSLKMNGAFMVLGYDDSGKTAISEETGKGHSHKPNVDKKLSTGVVRESSGTTVLEFSLPSAGFLNENSLKILVAYGRKDNFTSFHAKHQSIELPLIK